MFVTQVAFRGQTIEYLGDRLLAFVIESGGISIDITLPLGYSPEGGCFFCRESEVLISGDLLFEGNVHRSELDGGNAIRLKDSVEKNAELEIGLFLPGHIIIDRKEVKGNHSHVINNLFCWV